MGGVRVLLTADAVGGVWTYALDLACGLAGHGFAPILAVLGPSPSQAQREAVEAGGIRLLDTGLPLDWIAAGPDDVRAAAAALADAARQEAVEAVLLHAPALAAAAWPVPVMTMHHSCVGTWWQAVKPGAPMPEDFAWRTALCAEGLAASDIVAAPTEAHARAVARFYGLAAMPRCIHNGRRTAANVASDADQLFVLTAGRLWDEGKNLAALDAAAALMCAPLLAAGPLKSPWGRASLKHGKALGPVDEAGMRRWMARAPVFASVAVYEPFGYCVLEAAQSGCALVLADTPGFRELWDGAAVFVPPSDPAAIAEATNGVLFDTELTQRLSQAARTRAGRYTAARMVRDTGAVLRELSSRRRGAAA